MLQFSALNKNQLPELLTANLTFMETPQNVTKPITEIFFFTGYIILKSKAHSRSNKQAYETTAGPYD